MELFDMIGHASIMARVSLLVTLFPLAAGVAYLLRPTEQRLALMRPISLVGIFNGLTGAALGLMNVLQSYAIHDPPPSLRIMAVGAAEALVTLFVAFGCLTVAWLCVAMGMRRTP
jgi:formate hydrogenlyase subunit 3/multisubunit Na+/H+ antiporter MnhD subunit